VELFGREADADEESLVADRELPGESFSSSSCALADDE